MFVTNDHTRSAAELESEHRHKAHVEAGMRELKSNDGLGTIPKHGFMANWTWLLLVCLAHNLCCWTQQFAASPPAPNAPTSKPNDSQHTNDTASHGVIGGSE